MTFDVARDKAFGSELLENVGRQVLTEVHIAGSGLGDAQVAVDFGLGCVGADRPQFDTTLDLLA